MSGFDLHELEARADNQSAQVIQIDNGKAVQIVAICAAMCGLCLGLMFTMYQDSRRRESEVNDQLTISQNHWRNLEVDVRELQRAK